MIWFVQENVRTGELRYPHGKPGGGRHRRDVVSDTSRLWPNGVVYYSINANLKSQSKFFLVTINLSYACVRFMHSEVRILLRTLLAVCMYVACSMYV